MKLIASVAVAVLFLAGVLYLAATSVHQIKLTWNASVTPNVTYTVKRSTVSGGPYTTQVSGITGLSYADNGLAGNSKFCYVITSTLVTAAGSIESSPSTEVCATTPVDTVTVGPPTNPTATPIN